MNNTSDKRVQMLLDFIVYLATFLVAINFGCLLLSWLMEFVVSLVNFWTNDGWSNITSIMIQVLPTMRMIVGVSSIFISLLLAYNKLRPHFLAMNLPDATLSSQDVPNINGFDPATKQRLENVLTIIIKILAVALVAIIALDILHFLLTQSAEILPASSLPLLIIGVPTLIGLVVLRLIIHNK